MNKNNETRGESSILGGADGKLHGRQLAAWICFLLGVALLIQGTFIPPAAGIQAKVVPAIVALVFSLAHRLGFAYILSAHSDKRAKKRPAAEASP